MLITAWSDSSILFSVLSGGYGFLKLPDAFAKQCHLGIKGIYSSLPTLTLFMPTFPEILHRLITFSESIIISTILALDGAQSRFARSLLVCCYFSTR
jgi:hypothetical protein